MLLERIARLEMQVFGTQVDLNYEFTSLEDVCKYFEEHMRFIKPFGQRIYIQNRVQYMIDGVPIVMEQSKNMFYISYKYDRKEERYQVQCVGELFEVLDILFTKSEFTNLNSVVHIVQKILQTNNITIKKTFSRNDYVEISIDNYVLHLEKDHQMYVLMFYHDQDDKNMYDRILIKDERQLRTDLEHFLKEI